MPAPKDLTGQKFTRLTPLRCIGSKGGNRIWECRCDCGTVVNLPVNTLVFGSTQSCGCLNKERVSAALKARGYNRESVSKVTRERNWKHGHSQRGAQTPTYKIWCSLAYRKGYVKAPDVCELWRTSYEAFLADMGERPSDKHSIDRIDNARGYEPGNCRWATMKQQQNNRTNNRRITFNGETLTLMQWAERTGFARETIARRIDLLGWPIEEALTRKPDPRPRSSIAELVGN